MTLGKSEIEIEIENDIIKKQYDGIYLKVKKELYESYTRKIVKLKLEQGIFEDKELQARFNQYKELLSSQSQKDKEYYFITICPYPDLELFKLVNVMEKVLKKKWMKKYLYVYEQRQHESGKPYFGIHTHILVERDGIAKSDVIREVYNTCKGICGSKQSIDVKLISTLKDLQTRLNYLLGTKATELKQQRQQVDKEFRQANKLSSSYIVGEWDESVMEMSKAF